MAPTKCPNPNCVGMSFRLQELNIKNSHVKLVAVCCELCGTVVSTEPGRDVIEILHRQNEALKRIAAALNISVNL